MKETLERRFFRTEVRATRKDGAGEGTVSGYAAVFNDTYEYSFWDGTKVIERIAPGAFKRAIAEKQDVRCLFNHDDNYILGRTKSGTLKIEEDSRGLKYDCEPPNTPVANSIVASIQRGDVDGSSFGFYVRKQEMKETEDAGKVTIERTILDVDMYDVSPVTNPAYTRTSVEARSAMFPEGLPMEFRDRGITIEKRDADCECDCPECEANDCENCSDPDCEDPNCEGSRTEHKHAKELKTQREAAAAAEAEKQRLEAEAATQREADAKCEIGALKDEVELLEIDNLF